MKKFNFKKFVAVVLAVMTMGVFIACGNSNIEGNKVDESKFSVTITDSTGETITLDKKPERIVSMAPSTTEIVAALGAEDKLVGRTKYCNYPESILKLPEVGGTKDPNVEKIIELQPDLVVGSTHVSQEVIDKLREVGIPTVFVNEQENFEGTYSAIEKVAQLIGEEDKAKEIVNAMKKKVEDTTKKVEEVATGEKLKVYYAVGFGDYDSTAGGDTFIGEIITLSGGNNIAQDVQGWSYSKEKIVENDPDIIIVPAGMKESLETADFYKDLRAVKEGNVFEIDRDMISRQGPRVADAFEEMAKIINPEMK